MKNSGIEWIGEIPETWNVERLQWYIDEVKVSNNPIQTNKVLSLTNKAGVIPYEEKGAQGNVSKEDYTQYKLAYPDTIVANSMNILIGSVGICRYFGCVSPVYYVFKPNKNADLEFINYIFQCTPFQKELRRYANGILEIRLRVSANGILKRKVAIPSFVAQKKIVDAINTSLQKVDALIANQQEQIEKLKEYKQAVITEAVTKGLNLTAPMKDSGIEWIGEVPEEWNCKKIKYLFSESTERNTYETYELLTFSATKGLLPFAQHTDKLPSAEDLSNYKVIHIGELCMNRMQAWHGMFTDSLIEGCVSPDYAVFKPYSDANVRYYAYLFRTSSFVQQFANLSKGIGTGFNRLYTPSFFQVEACYPIKQTQDEIVEWLDKKCAKIDKLIALKKQKIEKLNEYKKSLIYEYVTGKKEVV